MKQFVTVCYFKCKTSGCGKRIQLARPFVSGESRRLQCREGHVNRYNGTEIKTQTAEVKVGK